jgi:hypothetical protein
MYPGVPLVSLELSNYKFLAIPKSVTFKYPLESNTKFSGLMSLWIIDFEWAAEIALKTQETKNFVYSSVKTLFLEIWYLKSPPVSKSITKNKLSWSWNA